MREGLQLMWVLNTHQRADVDVVVARHLGPVLPGTQRGIF